MGRPLNKKYFGNRNIGTGGDQITGNLSNSQNYADDRIGGSRVGSVTVGGVNNSTGYTTGDAVTFSAPQLPGGVTATGTVVATAGVIDSITMVEVGSGYTEAPTVTAGTGTIGTTTLTAVLQADTGAVGSATNQENAIIIHANTGNEGSQTADIIRQVSTRRYKVLASDGIAICKLVATDTPTVNEAYIKATDANGNTYFVTKLTAHKATLTQWANNESTWLVATDESVQWTFDAPTGVIVQIENA